MNVTIKIDDELCRQARHKAVDANLSLSGWVAQVHREAGPSRSRSIEKEVHRSEHAGKTMREMLAMDDDRDLMEFIPPRDEVPDRPVQFP